MKVEINKYADKRKRESVDTGISAPNVIHGPSKESQKQWMQDEMYRARTTNNRVQNGKGSTPRTNPNSQQWRDNYESIFGHE